MGDCRKPSGPKRHTKRARVSYRGSGTFLVLPKVLPFRVHQGLGPPIMLPWELTTSHRGKEHHRVIRSAADRPSGGDPPRESSPPTAMAVPGGHKCRGRVLAGDGVPQADSDHGSAEHGPVWTDKDGLGRPVRDRSVPGRDGRGRDGDG